MASSGFTGLCVPQPKIMVIFSSLTLAECNSSIRGGSIVDVGVWRVASSTTIAILFSGFAISVSFLELRGSLSALVISALGSDAPSCSFGSIVPSKFLAGTLTHTFVFP